MQRPDAFRSLAEVLRAPAADVHVFEEPVPESCEFAGDRCAEEEAELGRELRLFRARVSEGVDAAVEALVQDIAADVLGRELLLAPANVTAIVERSLQRYFAEEPLRVRVHPSEAASLSCSIPAIGDERLRPGDAIVELKCGSVDATLGVRLAQILRRTAT